MSLSTRPRLSSPVRSIFGPAFWFLAGLALFGWLYAASSPSGEVAKGIAAAGPDGVTGYFASPEAAVIEINAMLASRGWARLARYYDFTDSAVLPKEVLSGAYFTGDLAVPPEPSKQRPFPPGYAFVYSEPTQIDEIWRVVVASASPGDREPAPRATFLLRRSPEGYRVVPADAFASMKATASQP